MTERAKSPAAFTRRLWQGLTGGSSRTHDLQTEEDIQNGLRSRSSSLLAGEKRHQQTQSRVAALCPVPRQR